MIKTPQEIEKMRRSGAVVREVLEHVRAHVKPGVTTLDLETAAESKMAELWSHFPRSRAIVAIPVSCALR